MYKGEKKNWPTDSSHCHAKWYVTLYHTTTVYERK